MFNLSPKTKDLNSIQSQKLSVNQKWELSGPLPINRNGLICRECKTSICKNEKVMVRLREKPKTKQYQHVSCFQGDADPFRKKSIQDLMCENPNCEEKESIKNEKQINKLSYRNNLDQRVNDVQKAIFKRKIKTPEKSKQSVASRGQMPNVF